MKKLSYLIVLVMALGLLVFAQHEWTYWTDQGLITYATANTPGKAYYPSVLYDSNAFGNNVGEAIGITGKTYQILPKYKMWHGSGVQFAYSEDGDNWYYVGNLLGADYHSTVVYDAGGFSGTAINYKMWFWGSNTIKYAESTDGIFWTNVQFITGSLVGGWSSWNLGIPTVVYNASGSATLDTEVPFNNKYYGYSLNQWTPTGQEVVGLGISADGIYWELFGEGPVLQGTGNTQDWDRHHTSWNTVMKRVDGWHMWYSGGNNYVIDPLGKETAKANQGIGYAYSSDGITWARVSANRGTQYEGVNIGDAILHVGDEVDYRIRRTYTPTVIDDGSGLLRMYYSAKSNEGIYAIGYATADGVSVLEVEIDIKPGSDQNTINLSSAGVISVAILSSDTFDATTVDPETVRLAGAGVKMAGKSGKYLSQERDVNNDGLLDLVCQVLTEEFMIEPDESIAVLEAKTFDGQSIRGEDTVRIVKDN